MRSPIEMLLNGLRSLTSEELTSFISEGNKYIKERRRIEKQLEEGTLDGVASNESFHINFGPVPGGCPCCGKPV